METLIQNIGLTNTTFNRFLILSNKNIGFLLKFYYRFSEQYYILELQSLFTTFKSLKSVKLLMHAVVQNPNLKRFLWNSSRCTRRQWWPIQIAPIRSRWVEFTQSNIGSWWNNRWWYFWRWPNSLCGLVCSNWRLKNIESLPGIPQYCRHLW